LHGDSQEDIDEIKRTFVDVRQDVATWKFQIKNASDVGAKPDQSPEPKKSENDKGHPFSHQKRGGRQGRK
jgi:hypothetical protein